jgi:hypothetical protein
MCRRTKLCLEDTKAAGATHRCNQLYTTQVGTHGSDHDWRIDAETLAEAGSKHGGSLSTCCTDPQDHSFIAEKSDGTLGR